MGEKSHDTNHGFIGQLIGPTRPQVKGKRDDEDV